MAAFVSQSWLIQRIPSPTIVQVSTVGTRPVSSTVSPARRCHHTSPSRSGTEVRGRTTRAKNATTATALIGSRSFTSAKGIAAGPAPVAGTFGRSRREGQPLDSPAMSRLRRLPSPTVVLVAAAGLVLLAVVIGRGINDPDYFWHVTVGRLITTSGVPSVDPFSFTWFGQPWTPHEWLGEVLMACHAGCRWTDGRPRRLRAPRPGDARLRGPHAQAPRSADARRRRPGHPGGGHPRQLPHRAAAGAVLGAARGARRLARCAPCGAIALGARPSTAVRRVGEPPRPLGGGARRPRHLHRLHPRGPHRDGRGSWPDARRLRPLGARHDAHPGRASRHPLPAALRRRG